jgi:hypothetical protein
MPSVTIDATDPNTPSPNPAKCTPTDQTITWSLKPNAAAFAAAPILFPKPPSKDFAPWPGGKAVVNLKNNTVTAAVNHVLTAPGKRKYRYKVVLASGKRFDPDIENTGPGGVEPPEDKPRPRKKKA